MQWWVCYASKTLENILQNIKCVVAHITVQREKRSQPVLFLQILKSCRLICALKQSIPPPPFPSEKHDANMHAEHKKSASQIYQSWNQSVESRLVFLKHPRILLNTTYSFSGSQGSWIPSRQESTLDESHTHTATTHTSMETSSTRLHTSIWSVYSEAVV